MKVVLTANLVPFMLGGADHMIQGLDRALRRAGHDVALLRFPFKFSPAMAIESLMSFCESLDATEFNGLCPDQVISLQFPGYGVQHPDHRIWLMHQHRRAYDLYDDAQACY